jgi:hypothetical protein
VRGRNVFLILLVVLMGLFAWRNWAIFSEERLLSLVFTQVTAPFGIVLLTIMAVLVVVYFLYTVGLETAALIEVKKYARELLSTRKLADEAEASRFAELKKWLETDFKSVDASRADEILVRIDKAEQELREDIEKSGNTIAAYIGELEDQLLDKPKSR